MSELPDLLVAALDDVPGAVGVLNDYLEERGLEPVDMSDASDERLAELLCRFWSERERLEFAAECVEHVVRAPGLKFPAEVVPGEVLGEARRRWAEEPRRPVPMQTLYALSGTWGEEAPVDPRSKQALMALWALLRDSPAVALRNARAVEPGERTWQIERLKTWLATRPARWSA